MDPAYFNKFASQFRGQQTGGRMQDLFAGGGRLPARQPDPSGLIRFLFNQIRESNPVLDDMLPRSNYYDWDFWMEPDEDFEPELPYDEIEEDFDHFEEWEDPDYGQPQTKKYPSDSEDGGRRGEQPIRVETMKAPSDNEDGGEDISRRAATGKWPSDNEDGGSGEISRRPVTAKWPSDNEDGGRDIGRINVTQRWPSDHEDGHVGRWPIKRGTEPINMTMKAPSDNEDGGAQTLAYPSDHEGGTAIGRGGGQAMTMKAPSDNEDGGSGGSMTDRFPSDYV